MTAYRFCRTDDIALLVDALNRCWSPYFPDEPLMTPATFKRSIRDLQVWCSSCMVAFSGSDPIGVLIGAKRPAGTLVHKIAVHPDHRRQGHGRHLLASLGSKLAILGPPRILAEVPETLAPACGLFSASGYAQEALLTDYILQREENDAREVAGMSDPSRRSASRGGGRGLAGALHAEADDHDGRLVIPVTVDDLAANGLLGEAHPQVCWKRSVETLTATKDDIAGLAVASDERIEAYLLYMTRGLDPEGIAEAGPPTFARSFHPELPGDLAGALAEAGPRASAPTRGPDDAVCPSWGGAAEIVSLRTFIEDGGVRLKQLLSRLRARGMRTFRFPKVHPAEISKEFLETLGFRPAGGHLLYAARARSA
jgi:GNAT superfamily N-acetyltransferase